MREGRINLLESLIFKQHKRIKEYKETMKNSPNILIFIGFTEGFILELEQELQKEIKAFKDEQR